MQSAVKFAYSFFLRLSISLYFSLCPVLPPHTIRAQSKTWPLTHPSCQWWQFSLMSARLIGPSFINARSIEIDDGGRGARRYRRSFADEKRRLYASTRVFIKYDDYFLGTILPRIGRIDRVATCDCNDVSLSFSRFISLYERFRS